MKYDYANWWDQGLGYYSEIQTQNLEPDDWTVDVRVLSLWFYGDAGNAAGGVEQMYVGLEDNSGPSSYRDVRYGDGDGEDVDDITIEEWQEWGIFTSDLTDVNLADLYYLAIGLVNICWIWNGNICFNCSKTAGNDG